MNKILFGCI